MFSKLGVETEGNFIFSVPRVPVGVEQKGISLFSDLEVEQKGISMFSNLGRETEGHLIV